MFVRACMSMCLSMCQPVSVCLRALDQNATVHEGVPSYPLVLSGFSCTQLQG